MRLRIMKRPFIMLGLITALSVSCGKKSDSSSGSDSATTGSGDDDSNDNTSTSVVISGSLNMTGSEDSGSSLALTAADPYWFKCVTLDLTNASACIDDVDSDGAFELSCDGFKGKKFGCFILQGADENTLTLKGMVTSDQLAASESTSTVSLGIDFDLETGVAKASTVAVKTDSGEEDTVAAELAKEVSEELKSLSVDSGNYEFRYCQNNINREKASKGEVQEDQITENDCHHVEPMYVHFTAASATTAPVIELWRSDEDREACYVNDVLTYAISDGSKSFTFTGKTFDDLFTAIKNNGWTSQAALDRLAMSEKEAEAKTGEEDEFMEVLASLFGEDYCGGLVDKLIEGYEGASLVSESGFSRCENIAVDTGNAQMDEMLTQDGPPPQWCVDYKQAKAESDDLASAARNKFVLECNLHVKGGNDSEQIWAKRDLVEPFLRNLGEVRHRSATSRFEDFKGVWESFDLDAVIGRIEADTQTSTDEDSIEDLLVEWEKVAWDHMRRQQAKIARENLTTAKTELAINGVAKTGLEWAAGILKTGTHARQELERMACDGQWEFDFRNVNLAHSVITTFLSKVSGNSMGEISLKNSADEFADVIDPVMDFLLAEGSFASSDKQVSGCTAVHLKDRQQYLTQLEQCESDPSAPGCGGGSGDFDPARDMASHFYRTISEGKKSLAIRSVKIQDADQDNQNAFELAACESNRDCTEAREELTALRDNLLAIAKEAPMHMGWLAADICRLDGTHLNANGGFQLGEDSLLCGGTIDKTKPYAQGFMHYPPELTANGTKIPSQDANDNRKLLDKLHEMQNRAFNVISQESQRFDTAYQDKIRLIARNSSCIPDATISRDPMLKEGADVSSADASAMTFALKLRAPAFRKMAGEVMLALKEEADSSDTLKFNAAEERLEKEGGGIGSDVCVRGEVVRLSNFYLKDGDLFGGFSQAYKDGCFSGGSQDSEGEGEGEEGGATPEHGFHAIFKASKIAE